jgi:hypothetical protein
MFCNCLFLGNRQRAPHKEMPHHVEQDRRTIIQAHCYLDASQTVTENDSELDEAMQDRRMTPSHQACPPDHLIYTYP